MTIARAELALDSLDDDRLRAAAAQMHSVGGDVSLVGRALAEWLSGRPAARVSRRDAALVALDEHFLGSGRERARLMASDLARYGATRWRSERALDAAPATHGEKGRALHAVMRSSPKGKSPGYETIRKAMQSQGVEWVKKHPVANTHAGPDASSDTRKRRRKLQMFKPGPNEFEALAALARQPSTAKIVEADRARIVDERKAKVERIRQLDAAAEVAWPKSQRAIAEAAKAVREAERRLREANDALAAANAANAGTNHTYTRERQAEETALIAGADMGVINAWRSELLDMGDAARRHGVLAHVETTARNPVTRESTRRVSSNYASVVARLTAIRAAYEAVGLLALEPDQARLPEIIAGLRDRLPKIDAGPTFPVASEGEAV